MPVAAEGVGERERDHLRPIGPILVGTGWLLFRFHPRFDSG